MELLNIQSDSKEADQTLLSFLDMKHERFNNGYLIPALGAAKWDGHIYVSGSTGAGKSYLIKEMVMNDEKKRDILIFSDLEEDESFNELYDSGLVITLAEATDENPNNPYKDRIVIFDDCTQPEITVLRDHLLKKGRHDNVTVICVNHKFKEWKETLNPLNESKYIVLFPSSNKLSVVKFLDELGFDRKKRDAIIKLANDDGRYLIFHKHNPNALITQKTVLYI